MLASCLAVLEGCWPVKINQARCRACEGAQQHKLQAAGCTELDIAKYCTTGSGGQPAPSRLAYNVYAGGRWHIHVSKPGSLSDAVVLADQILYDMRDIDGDGKTEWITSRCSGYWPTFQTEFQHWSETSQVLVSAGYQPLPGVPYLLEGLFRHPGRSQADASVGVASYNGSRHVMVTGASGSMVLVPLLRRRSDATEQQRRLQLAPKLPPPPPFIERRAHLNFCMTNLCWNGSEVCAVEQRTQYLKQWNASSAAIFADYAQSLNVDSMLLEAVPSGGGYTTFRSEYAPIFPELAKVRPIVLSSNVFSSNTTYVKHNVFVIMSFLMMLPLTN